MTLEEYTEFVISRAKPGEDIVSEIDNAQAHLLHMAVGLIGEVVELFAYTDRENLIEELGDIEFYFTGLLIGLSIEGDGSTAESRASLKHHSFANESNGMHSVLQCSGEILDLCKKASIYQKPLNTEGLTEEFAKLRYALDYLLMTHDLSVYSIREANKKKLTLRYKQGYSNKAAQERADKQ
jgi:phosphoribosyl-ATP pyrophosphohydrolase